MIKRLFIYVFLFVSVLSCGDDPDTMEEMEMEDSCGGEITIMVDGVSEEFATPLSATFVDVALSNGSELLVVWQNGGKSLNFQLVVNESNATCFPTGRIEMKNLPSNISIFSFQYTDIAGPIASVSNIFIEDGGDGWIDIKSCDGDDDVLDVTFEFDAVTGSGDLVSIRGGSSENICFERTK